MGEMQIDDMELLRQYARTQSEQAFAKLVSRYVDLVHSVVLRQVRDPHLAEEITQTVFIILARKAGSLSSRTIVPGWLCRTARFVATRTLTTQFRRQRREQEAYMQSSSHDESHDVWSQIEPQIESAMAQLGAADQNAVVLRFYQRRSFKEVSAALGTSEAGAKMRVSRALEKLRKLLFKRGVTLSSLALAGAISSHSVQAAPVGLASSITVAAVKGTSLSASTLTLIQSTLKLMAWTKIKTTLVVGTVALLVVGTATVTYTQVQSAAKSTAYSFAGYATPEASIKSMLWSGSRGDFKGFLAACTPEQAQRFKDKMAGKTDDEVKKLAIAWASSLKDYQITQNEIISDDEVHLHIHATPSADGLRNGKVIVIMKKIGDEWKQDGDL